MNVLPLKPKDMGDLTDTAGYTKNNSYSDL